MNMSNFLQNRIIDGLFRGGALGATGAVNSTAVVKGVWTASTAYNVGDVVVPGPQFTGAGGKFLQCSVAGTSGTVATLAAPAVGSTLVDGGVTWVGVSGLPAEANLYVALFSISSGFRASSNAYTVGQVISVTANGGAGGDTKQHLYRCTTAGTTASSQAGYLGVPGEVITDGTAVFTEISPVLQAGTGFPSGLAEVSGGSYARATLPATLAALSGTQSAGSTTASSGISAQTSNNTPVTFPAPTAAWATAPAAIGAFGIYDQPTGGNLLFWAVLTVPKTVNNGDSAPSFAASALTMAVDN
jgi:hypothetical protein